MKKKNRRVSLKKNCKKSSKTKKGVLIGIGAALTLTAVDAAAARLAFSMAMERKSLIAYEPSKEHMGTQNIEPAEGQKSMWESPWIRNFTDDVYITSEDGLKLHARTAKNENSHKWIINCHGYRGNCIETGNTGKHFFEKGYNTLTPDARGHGKSEGKYVTMGWSDRRDIVLWSRWILEQDEAAEIVLYGCSMGGATVMMASGEKDLPDNVKCIVEDCGYTSVWDQFESELHSLFHLPAFPLLYTADLICLKKCGFTFKKASAVKQVSKCKVPMLFIHGTDDKFVPFKMLRRVYNACTVEKEIMQVEGAGHALSGYVNEEEYWKKIDCFVDKYIGI